jgi:hypothetical protein
MRTTKESIRFYIGLVNSETAETAELYLQSENGTNNVKTIKGDYLIFSGTKKEVYKFLVGIYRIMCL